MAYPILSAGAAVVGLLAFYLWRINLSWKYVPSEGRLSPWTAEQMHEAYERIKKNRLDFSNILPPRLDRRYMVVGGSGLSALPRSQIKIPARLTLTGFNQRSRGW